MSRLHNWMMLHDNSLFGKKFEAGLQSSVHPIIYTLFALATSIGYNHRYIYIKLEASLQSSVYIIIYTDLRLASNYIYICLCL